MAFGRQVKRVSFAFGAALAALLVACGDGSDRETQAKDSVESYFEALSRGRGDEACRQLSGTAIRDLREYEKEQFMHVPRFDCATSLRRVYDVAKAFQGLEELESVEAEEADLDDGRGEVSTGDDDPTVPVVEEDGNWKIERLPLDTDEPIDKIERNLNAALLGRDPSVCHELYTPHGLQVAADEEDVNTARRLCEADVRQRPPTTDAALTGPVESGDPATDRKVVVAVLLRGRPTRVTVVNEDGLWKVDG